jgi:hypothetical protein
VQGILASTRIESAPSDPLHIPREVGYRRRGHAGASGAAGSTTIIVHAASTLHLIGNTLGVIHAPKIKGVKLVRLSARLREKPLW